MVKYVQFYSSLHVARTVIDHQLTISFMKKAPQFSQRTRKTTLLLVPYPRWHILLPTQLFNPLNNIDLKMWIIYFQVSFLLIGIFKDNFPFESIDYEFNFVMQLPISQPNIKVKHNDSA